MNKILQYTILIILLLNLAVPTYTVNAASTGNHNYTTTSVPWWWVPVYSWYELHYRTSKDMFILGVPLNSPYPGSAEYKTNVKLTYEFSYAGGLYTKYIGEYSFTWGMQAVNGESKVTVLFAKVNVYDEYKCTIYWIPGIGFTPPICDATGNSYATPVQIYNPAGTWSYELPPDWVDNTIPVLITVDPNGNEIGRYSVKAYYQTTDWTLSTNSKTPQYFTISKSQSIAAGISVDISVSVGAGVSVGTSLSFKAAVGTSASNSATYEYHSFNYGQWTYHDMDFIGKSGSQQPWPIVIAWRTRT